MMALPTQSAILCATVASTEHSSTMRDMPILTPPYLSAQERRRYAKLLGLPRHRVERRFLLLYYEWLVQTVGFQYAGDDLMWDSRAMGCRINLSEVLYILVSACGDFINALNRTRSAKPLPAARERAATTANEVRVALSERVPKRSAGRKEIVDHTKRCAATGVTRGARSKST